MLRRLALITILTAILSSCSFLPKGPRAPNREDHAIAEAVAKQECDYAALWITNHSTEWVRIITMPYEGARTVRLIDFRSMRSELVCVDPSFASSGNTILLGGIMKYRSSRPYFIPLYPSPPLSITIQEGDIWLIDVTHDGKDLTLLRYLPPTG